MTSPILFSGLCSTNTHRNMTLMMMKLRIASQALVLAVVVAAAAFSWPLPGVVRIVALVAAAWLASQRTTWLPFLGCSVVPTGVLSPRAPVETDFSLDIPVTCPRAIAVVYWAATIRASDPVKAYGDYSNAGVASVGAGHGRNVRVYLKKPVAYLVGGKALKPHVHYRWVFPGGMLGAVKTLYV